MIWRDPYVDTAAIYLPRSVVERLSLEAERLGLSLEEYVLELLLQPLDPAERAREYISAAKEMLNRAWKALKEGDVRQAAEKVWGAAALAVKAYAAWREGRRLTSHGELWRYRRRLEKELGEWVYDSWMSANGMHTCFYENWCGREDVEEAFRRVSRLVEEVEKAIRTGPPSGGSAAERSR